MLITRQSPALKKIIARFKNKKETIGFVPTMGYLHEGHLSLVRRARKENDRVVTSIFVNPLQFGPKEDLKRYPRKEVQDLKMLKNEGADLVFIPKASNFYPREFQTGVCVKALSRPLCGATRPTHFAGVATVVLKLLNLVSPDALYLGQKDYQQFRVVQQMMHDLDVPARLRLCATVREKDGLAMSSRNHLLDAEERMHATYLNRALGAAEALVRKGAKNAQKLKETMRKELSGARRARIDYAEIVNAATLLPVVQLKPGQKIELALAVFFSKTRLIDNRLVRVP